MRTRALALVLCCSLCSVAGEAPAQGTDLRIIAPSAPGTGWDHIAQTLRLALAEKGGLNASVTNVPGAGGIVGLTQFLGTEAETELLVTGLTMLDASLLGRAAASFERLTPVARLSFDYYGLVVPANSPLKSAQDLGAILAADPARVTWAGGPPGGVDHVAAILLADAVGVGADRLNYVAFLTSTDATIATAEDKVSAAILAVSDIQGEIASGRLRLLGVAAPGRIAAADSPTLTEAGIPLEFANWRGLAAKPGLSPAQQLRLAALVYLATTSPVWQATLASRKWESAFLGPEPFQAFVRGEHHRVKDALRRAGILKRQGD
jgi:putative tricarboxylic transport membrane protein